MTRADPMPYQFTGTRENMSAPTLIIVEVPTLRLLLEQTTCPICREQFSEPITLCCQHTFCFSCLYRHLASSIESPERTIPSCPCCRKVVSPDFLLSFMEDAGRPAYVSDLSKTTLDLVSRMRASRQRRRKTSI